MYDEIIDNYVGEVAKELGSRQRREVIQELKTHILDSADSLAAERKVSVDDAIVKEVIARMGPAEKIAAMYPARESFFWKQISAISIMAKALAWVMIGSLLLAALLVFVTPFSVAGVSMPAILVTVYWLAFIAIAIINICIYLAEPGLKAPYDLRLKELIRGLMGPASPVGILIMIVIVSFWIISLNLYWSRVQFVADFSQGTRLVPVFAANFAGFLPYINSLTLLTMAILLSRLVVEQKWIVEAMETVLAITWTLLMAWMLMAFPFNAEISASVATVFKALMAAAIVTGFLSIAKKLWKATRSFAKERQGPKMMI